MVFMLLSVLAVLLGLPVFRIWVPMLTARVHHAPSPLQTRVMVTLLLLAP